MKILIIVTNVATYANGKLPTGLWLSELTHIYHSAREKAFEITIASPKGGNTPVDPESLKPLVLDRISKGYLANPEFMALLKDTEPLGALIGQDFDLIYLAGGHGTMYDFPDNIGIQSMVSSQYENGRLVAAICHGVGGLLNVKLSNGEYLIKGKTITGFDWFEETIARRKKFVPFNLEAALKARGVHYKKALIPMTSNVAVDGLLITGQNPFSSVETARVVMQHLSK